MMEKVWDFTQNNQSKSKKEMLQSTEYLSFYKSYYPVDIKKEKKKLNLRWTKSMVAYFLPFKKMK